MMRALVLSDIHGEESRLRWMLEETWKMTGKIDGYFFLGDGVDGDVERVEIEKY